MLEKLGYGHVISGPAVIMNGNSMASLLTFIRNKGLISISLYSLFFFWVLVVIVVMLTVAAAEQSVQ